MQNREPLEPELEEALAVVKRLGLATMAQITGQLAGAHWRTKVKRVRALVDEGLVEEIVPRRRYRPGAKGPAPRTYRIAQAQTNDATPERSAP